MTKEDYQKLGDDLAKELFKAEVIEYDKFMPEHSFEFRLSVASRSYVVTQPYDQVNEQTAKDIWLHLFSDVLALFNLGMAEKAKNK